MRVCDGCAALVIGALGLASPVAGEEPLVSNRPGFSNTWEVVEPGRVELNAGLQVGRVEDDETISFGQVLVRAGLTERLELRLGLNSYVDLESPSGDLSGFEDPTLGVKLQLFEGSGEVGAGKPEAALILQSTVPIGSDRIGASDPQPAGILVLSWDPGARLHLDTNHGVSYLDTGADRLAEAFASYGLAVSLVGELALYLEYAAFLPLERGADDASFLFAALTYLSSPRLQLDLGVGRGLNREDPDHFVSAGIAYRW